MSPNRCIGWLAVGCALAACASSQRMELPSELGETVDRYTVAGRVSLFQRTLSFGPYEATDARIKASGSESGATVLNGQTGHTEVHYKGSYQLVTKSGTFRATCEQDQTATTKHETSVDYRSRDGRGGLHVRDKAHLTEATRRYECSITPPSGSSIQVEQQSAAPGSVRGDDLEFSIAPVVQEENPPPIAWGLKGGYVLLEAGQAIGAIDLSEAASSVTISRQLSQERKDQVAAIATALLLKRDML